MCRGQLLSRSHNEWTPAVAAPAPTGLLCWAKPAGRVPWNALSPNDPTEVSWDGVWWWSRPDGVLENVAARDRWQFLPFLGGSRPCIGEHFARLETTLALATVVRAMTVESLDDDFACEVPFTTVAKGPIRARLRPRT